MEVVGREDEIAIMQEMLKIDRSSFLAIYGRRRIGKTYLIDQVFKKQMIFTMSGLHEATLEEQLENFSYTLAQYAHKIIPTPKNWLEAFQLLIDYSHKSQKKKKVIFFDELPWLSSPKSGFLASLEHFWNSWASKRNDIILVVCGSAASWMIKNIVQNKGGLHNRLTQTIRLMPFTLRETELMLNKQGVKLTKFSIAQLYMTIGGIPYYLKAVPKGKSIDQIINQMCYKKDGLLRREFEYLFQSLFSQSKIHLLIVRALAKKTMGYSRADLIRVAKLSNAGSTTRALEELEESGFILKIPPLVNVSKDAIYRLVDFYTLFYLKYIENVKTTSNTFLSVSRLSSWNSWLGYSFENLCILHIGQIKASLGIAGVNTKIASWIYRGSKTISGAQIDLIIDRDDQIATICEMKFTNNAFAIDKKYAQNLKTKINTFQEQSRTKKNVFLAFITANGLVQNSYELDLVQNKVILNDLYLA